MNVEEVRRVSEAQFAYCAECDTWLGSPYWPLAKSVALHKAGTGHEVTLYRWEEHPVLDAIAAAQVAQARARGYRDAATRYDPSDRSDTLAET